MKISKSQLRRIIKEEYNKLKRQGLIRESMHKKNHHGSQGAYMSMGPGGYYSDEYYGDSSGMQSEQTIVDLAAESGGIHIEELIEMFGKEVFEKIDELEAAELIKLLDDGTVVSVRGY